MEQKKTTDENDELGIVSVNKRSGTPGQMAGKLLFLVVVGSVLVIGLLMAMNTWRATRTAEAASEELAAKVENKPAQVGPKRVFDQDPLYQPHKRSSPSGKSRSHSASLTPGSFDPGLEHGFNESGRPMSLGNGTSGGRGAGSARASRFAGEAILANTQTATGPSTQRAQPTDTEAAIALVRNLMGNPHGSETAAVGDQLALASDPGPVGQSVGAGLSPLGMSAVGMPLPPGPAPSGAGAIGGLLTPSSTPKVLAGMIGDRNMILPKGKSIDCALTIRVVNEVAGMATCVLTADVYSDNGRVVLLDRGSEAVGEYSATMAQGQRRLFLLWTRVKTPQGVVINLNSPAADALGTSGLAGDVDNHWWDRLGAAFLLSIVQDAIGFATAQAAGGGAQGQLSIYQHSATTGNRMAEVVLQSTINIKPTLYKNQGDRATIFVARDLDFGTVYALHAE